MCMYVFMVFASSVLKVLKKVIVKNIHSKAMYVPHKICRLRYAYTEQKR